MPCNTLFLLPTIIEAIYRNKGPTVPKKKRRDNLEVTKENDQIFQISSKTMGKLKAVDLKRKYRWKCIS